MNVDTYMKKIFCLLKTSMLTFGHLSCEETLGDCIIQWGSKSRDT